MLCSVLLTLSFFLFSCSEEDHSTFLDITKDNIESLSLDIDGGTTDNIDNLLFDDQLIQSILSAIESYHYERYINDYLNVDGNVNGAANERDNIIIMISLDDKNICFSDLAVSVDDEVYHVTYITDEFTYVYGVTDIALFDALYNVFNQS